MRVEKDFLGVLEISDDALYGIHAARARTNFPDQTPFHREWYMSVGIVKLACYQTVLSFMDAAAKKYGSSLLPKALRDAHLFVNMCEVAFEVSTGKYFEHFIVPGIQGGAGTSVNMNINEIIANATLIKLGSTPGNYALVDPIEHANVFQSTNDVVPTALKIAAMQMLSRLELAINGLRSSVEDIEKAHRSSMRMAYTQMQEAVPSSLGLLFGAYGEALSRDWWRISKSFERIKVVNLGGGAAGTGMAVPRYFIMEVLPALQKLTGLPITRSDNLADATQNLDAIVEVHAILKAFAVNLEKMASDIRMLSSDFAGRNIVNIPARQAGSSIMPGKVNPVIPEFVISIAHKVYANDSLITSLCGQGMLDLNPYLPLIGHAFLESIRLLEQAAQSFHHHTINGLQIHPDVSYALLMQSPVITTALIPHIGYGKATELAMLMKQQQLSVHDANRLSNMLPPDKLGDILRPENLLQLGYSLKELKV